MKDHLAHLQPPEWLTHDDEDGFLTPLEQEMPFYGSGGSAFQAVERYGLQEIADRRYIDKLPARGLRQASDNLSMVSLLSRRTFPSRPERAGRRSTAADALINGILTSCR